MDYIASKKIILIHNAIGIVFGFLLFFLFTVAAENHLLGRIEGHFLPVARTTNFLSHVYTERKLGVSGEQYTLIQGDMAKLRNCNFIDIHAVITDPSSGIETYTKVIFLEDAKVRGVGNHAWGPWLIRVPYNKIITQNYKINLVTTHKCHSIWNTITYFR